MKKRTFIVAFTTGLILLAAAGFFAGRHIRLHRELPRTVENIAGEWFLRKLHAANVDPPIDDEWTDIYPAEEHNTFFTLHFDANYGECTKCKHEDAQIVHTWAYYWDLANDTLALWNKYDCEEFRIGKLTRSHLVLVIRRTNLQGETSENTYIYKRSSEPENAE